MKHSIAPRRLKPVFDDDSLIANAGMLPAVLLLDRLGIGGLADQRLALGNRAANPNRSDKLLTLVCSALAGGDCIDDADLLRSRARTPASWDLRSRRLLPWEPSCVRSDGTTSASWTQSPGSRSSAPGPWAPVRATNR